MKYYIVTAIIALAAATAKEHAKDHLKNQERRKSQKFRGPSVGMKEVANLPALKNTTLL